MTTPAPTFGVYYRGATKPRRWKLHDVYASHDEAMAAAIRLRSATSVWVTTIEPTATTSTEMTPAAAKGRPARGLFELTA